jgi:hypothetical protein
MEPGTELTSVEHPEFDVDGVVREVRSRAAALRDRARIDRFPALPEPAGDPLAELVLGPRHSPVSATAEILPYQPLTSRRVLSGRATIGLKRMVRRGLRWYLWPVTTRVSAHNQAAADVLAEHTRQLEWLHAETERIGRNVELIDSEPRGR